MIINTLTIVFFGGCFMVLVGNLYSIFVKEKYGFNYPRNKYTNRLSIKKLKAMVRSGQIENDSLLKSLRKMILINTIVMVLFSTALLIVISLIVLTLLASTKSSFSPLSVVCSQASGQVLRILNDKEFVTLSFNQTALAKN